MDPEAGEIKRIKYTMVVFRHVPGEWNGEVALARNGVSRIDFVIWNSLLIFLLASSRPHNKRVPLSIKFTINSKKK